MTLTSKQRAYLKGLPMNNLVNRNEIGELLTCKMFFTDEEIANGNLATQEGR